MTKSIIFVLTILFLNSCEQVKDYVGDIIFKSSRSRIVKLKDSLNAAFIDNALLYDSALNVLQKNKNTKKQVSELYEKTQFVYKFMDIIGDTVRNLKKGTDIYQRLKQNSQLYELKKHILEIDSLMTNLSKKHFPNDNVIDLSRESQALKIDYLQWSKSLFENVNIQTSLLVLSSLKLYINQQERNLVLKIKNKK